MNTWISVALLAFACFVQKGECAITGWTSPTIGTAAGNAALATKINNKVSVIAAGDFTITATSGHTGGVTAYTKVSQSPNTGTYVDFAIASSNGDITITSGTTDFATVPVYEFIVSANDADGTASTATVTLSVDNNPAFPTQQLLLCVPDGSAANYQLATIAASTTTTSTGFTYALATGDTNNHWDFDSSTALLKTNVVIASYQYTGYLLTITASDGTLTGTSTVVIGVGCSSGATTVFTGCITLFMALMAHLY